MANIRQMYGDCKFYSSQWSDHTLKMKLRELGSLKRWSPIALDESQKQAAREGRYPIFRNRITGDVINCNVEFMIKNRQTQQYEVARQMQLNEPHVFGVSDVFTEAQISTINNAMCNVDSVLSYGAGDRLYRNIGVLRDGPNDQSPSIGFELETQAEFTRNDRAVWYQSLNKYLGHFETDGSISGIEFDSHPFSWNMMKKAKPLFKQMFNEMIQSGLKTDEHAGLHIHVGRDAFANEDAFKKFFYLINCSALRQFNIALSRRESRNYGRYLNIEDSVASIERSIDNHSNDHGVAVNQQHSATYEVRIFQATLNCELVYSYLQYVMNLVEFCNSDKLQCTLDSDLLRNTKLSSMLILPSHQTVDVSFIGGLSREAYADLINAAISCGDYAEVVRLGNECQARFGATNVGGAR